MNIPKQKTQEHYPGLYPICDICKFLQIKETYTDESGYQIDINGNRIDNSNIRFCEKYPKEIPKKIIEKDINRCEYFKAIRILESQVFTKKHEIVKFDCDRGDTAIYWYNKLRREICKLKTVGPESDCLKKLNKQLDAFVEWIFDENYRNIIYTVDLENLLRNNDKIGMPYIEDDSDWAFLKAWYDGMIDNLLYLDPEFKKIYQTGEAVEKYKKGKPIKKKVTWNNIQEAKRIANLWKNHGKSLDNQIEKACEQFRDKKPATIRTWITGKFYKDFNDK